jgi:alpha-L-rhamnosidase
VNLRAHLRDELFTPGFTSYHKRLQYQVYDVTSLLEKGVNTAAVLLGDGWYRGNFPFKGNRNTYGSRLALLLQLLLEPPQILQISLP